MNKIENISMVVMEECAELQQAISKSLRFGYDCYHPSNPDTNNAKDILTEYYQLQVMMELLILKAGLGKYCSEEEIVQIQKNKIDKFLHYQDVSMELGYVEDDFMTNGVVGIYEGVPVTSPEDMIKEFEKLGYTHEEAKSFVEKTIIIPEDVLDQFNNLGYSTSVNLEDLRGVQ